MQRSTIARAVNDPGEKLAFDYMMKYSPCDNVKSQRYPAMLVEVSYNDSQVPYWEVAKFAAKIRAVKTNDSRVLARANMGAGHGMSSGRDDYLKEALEYHGERGTPHMALTP
ncbi:MAG: prolyl oligopeptidase family serine peptidase [Gemmatimonadaceae bacterium]